MVVGAGFLLAHHPTGCEVNEGMSTHSVRLEFQSGAAIYISPSKARRLRKDGKAVIASQRPFVLRFVSTVQRWSPTSDGRVMSGAVLEKNPPKL
jgi:hypothetical protein